MMEMCLEVGRGYEDVINVDKSKWETGTNLVHELLECPVHFNPKGIFRNSKNPKGVMMAVLGMSLKAMGTNG